MFHRSMIIYDSPRKSISKDIFGTVPSSPPPPQQQQQPAAATKNPILKVNRNISMERHFLLLLYNVNWDLFGTCK